jgi:Transglycosylase-like domain
VSQPCERAGIDRHAVRGCLQHITTVRPRRFAAAGIIGTALVAAALMVGAAPAAAAPSSDDWMRLRICESGNNYRTDTGNGFYGAYQFTLGTWHAYGGAGSPSTVSAAEQDRVAYALYQARGWRPWPGCSRRLGLRDDRRGRGSDPLPAAAVSRPLPEHVSRSAHRRGIVPARPAAARSGHGTRRVPSSTSHRRVRTVAAAPGKAPSVHRASPTWSAGDSGRWGRAAGGPATTALQNAGWPSARWVGAWMAAARLATDAGTRATPEGRLMRPQ